MIIYKAFINYSLDLETLHVLIFIHQFQINSADSPRQGHYIYKQRSRKKKRQESINLESESDLFVEEQFVGDERPTLRFHPMNNNLIFMRRGPNRKFADSRIICRLERHVRRVFITAGAGYDSPPRRPDSRFPVQFIQASFL